MTEQDVAAGPEDGSGPPGDAAQPPEWAKAVDPGAPTATPEPTASGEPTWALAEPVAAPSLAAAVEAILLVVDEPVSETTLAQVLERPRDEVAAVVAGLAADYDAQGRGFELREVAGGWRLYTRASCSAVVERFILDGQQARLTQAALETLAVVAYRQPVSRARVSAVRGVNVDGVMRTLTTRGLVEEAGVEHESGAILYRTTTYFLERLGLTSVEDLPELAPMLPELSTVDFENNSLST